MRSAQAGLEPATQPAGSPARARRLAWSLVPLGMFAILSSPPHLAAAPPTKDILREVDAFRAHAGPLTGTWSSADGARLVVQSPGDQSPDATPQDAGVALESDAPILARRAQGPGVDALLACFLACESIAELPTRLGATLDAEAIGLHFGPDDALLYTLGEAREAGTLQLVVERDTYRPRAATWVTPAGELVRVTVLSWAKNGWAIARLRVERGGMTTEFVRDGSGEHGESP